MKTIFHDIVDLLAQGQSFVLATVYDRSGSAPRAMGARMAALSDAELVRLAGGIENRPAGASGAWAIVISALLIYFLSAKPAMEGRPAAKK